MVTTIFVEINERRMVTGWASSRGTKTEIEIDIPDDHTFLKDNPFYYALTTDGELIINEDFRLNMFKSIKNAELNRKCSEAILAGFTHVVNGQTYWFSYDYEAQGSFGDAKDVLRDGIVPYIPWTVREGGEFGPYTRINVDMTIMQELTVAILLHKTKQISKYRDELMPLVESAKDIQEVQGIVWE